MKCKVHGELEDKDCYFSKRKNSKNIRIRCKVCEKTNPKKLLKSKEHYNKNKDRYSLKAKKYWQQNKEQLILKNKEYYKANKIVLLEKGKSWRSNNIERMRKLFREYYKKNKDKKSNYRKSIVLNLRDNYIKHLIVRNSILKTDDIPKSLVEIKREQIKLKRLIKDKKCQ